MKNYLIILVIFFYTQQSFAQSRKIVTQTNFKNWNDRNHTEDFFYNNEFKNAVDFSQSHFYKFADLSYSVFDTSANFSGSVFENPFLFDRGIITSWCDFDSVHFKSWAEFDSVVFQRVPNYYQTSFFKTQFDSDAYFYKATINNGWFDSAHFHKTADFNSTQFDSVTFMNTIFDSGVDFDSSKFRSWCDFSGAVFGNSNENSFTGFESVSFDTSAFFINTHFSTVSFSDDSILGIIYFDSARMGKKCYFSELHFGSKGGLSFYKTILPDTLDFYYNTNIPGIINLTEANFTDSVYFKAAEAGYIPHKINLYKTDISKFKLDYIHFRLYFDTTDRMSNEDKEIIYEGLLGNFKTNGQEESYKLLYIEYQTFKWNQDWWSRQFVWLPKWWWNWGYDKGLIFYRTLLFVCVFTFITYFFIYYLNKVYAMENIPVDKWQKKLSFKDFGNRLWFSFIYTSTVFFGLTLKIENIKFEKKWGTAYLILMYTLGLVCLAYMANFVLQK
jgi:uncharacterized protein YjbI with pentapeptide repeats